jgi:hypothetical protein
MGDCGRQAPSPELLSHVELGLSQICDSSANGRAFARLDRLTIGPQVANLPHNNR